MGIQAIRSIRSDLPTSGFWKLSLNLSRARGYLNLFGGHIYNSNYFKLFQLYDVWPQQLHCTGTWNPKNRNIQNSRLFLNPSSPIHSSLRTQGPSKEVKLGIQTRKLAGSLDPPVRAPDLRTRWKPVFTATTGVPRLTDVATLDLDDAESVALDQGLDRTRCGVGAASTEFQVPRLIFFADVHWGILERLIWYLSPEKINQPKGKGQLWLEILGQI